MPHFSGPQTLVGKLKIEGNEALPEGQIRGLITLSEGQPYSDSMVITDQSVILEQYSTLDFQGEIQFQRSPKRIIPIRSDVSYKIDEGAQVFVDKVLFAEMTRPLSVEREIKIGAGSMVITDQSVILEQYYNLGFPKVKFDYATQPEADNPNKIDVSYKIDEGAQVFVDKVLISGMNYTRPFIVEREIKIGAGDRLSRSQMLDSQRRLYDMGIFNEVGVAVQNPEGDATSKKVNFQLSEARRYTFNYGLGFEVQTGQPNGTTSPQGEAGADARVSFDVTRLNFRGRDHTLTLKTRYGNLEKLALIGYGAPRLFDSQKLTLDFTAFYQQTNDVSTFTSTRLEGSASIKQELNRATTLLYRLIYRRVSTSNLVIDPNLVPLFLKLCGSACRILATFAILAITRSNRLREHSTRLIWASPLGYSDRRRISHV